MRRWRQFLGREMSSLQAGWTTASFTVETSLLGTAGEYNSATVSVILLGYVVLLGTSGYFTHYVLRQAGMDIENTERETLNVDRDTGTVIGEIENVLILTLMLLGAYRPWRDFCGEITREEIRYGHRRYLVLSNWDVGEFHVFSGDWGSASVSPCSDEYARCFRFS